MKKLFTNDKFLSITVIASVLFALVYYVAMLVWWPDDGIGTQYYLLYVILILGLYISYKKHSKNIMKCLLGSVLTAMVAEALYWLENAEHTIDLYMDIIYLVLISAIFINHIVINSEHHSKPINILLNQIMLIVVAVVLVVWDIIWVPYSVNAIDTISQFCAALFNVTLVTVVICIESRLDSYRIDREVAGWTEEKGYPEGYVHEYEKK